MTLKSSRAKTARQLINELSNPPDLAKFVTPYIAKYIEKIPVEYINKDESDLLAEIRKQTGNPNWHPKPITETLRKSLWEQIEVSHRYGVIVNESKVYEGICTKGVFQAALEDPVQLAFICCKPSDYLQTVDALLARGYRRFEEILALPIKNKLGEVDTKLLDTIFKVVLALDQRKHGGFVQYSQILQKTELTHTNADSKEVQSQVMDIDTRIAQLEAKLLESKNLLPPPKEQDGEKENT